METEGKVTLHREESEIEAFTAAYMVDYNKTFTARRLGWDIMKVYRWCKNPQVKEVIARESNRIQEKFQGTLDETLNEFRRIAFFDHKDVIKSVSAKVEEGDFGVELHDFEDIDTRAVKNITITTSKAGSPQIHIEPYNKMEALREIKDYFMKIQGSGSGHAPITPEDLKKNTAIENSNNYMRLVQ